MSEANLIDARSLVGIQEAAESIGIDIAPQMEAVGLRPELLRNPRGFIPWTQVNELLESVAKEHNCQDFGLLAGAYGPPVGFGIVGQIMRFSPNLGTALKKAEQYLPAYTHSSYWETKSRGDFVTISRKSLLAQSEVYGQSVSSGIVLALKMLRVLIAPDWMPSSISFVHSEPCEKIKHKYRRFFAVPVSFGQEEDGIVISAADLSLNLVTADSQLLYVAEIHARSIMEDNGIDKDIVASVRLQIRRALSMSCCSISHVAQLLNKHPKNLHRELKKYDLTFKQLLNQERHSLAKFYLSKSSIDLLQLAMILDYNDASALSRAFKKQCGVSPQQWRSQHTGK